MKATIVAGAALLVAVSAGDAAKKQKSLVLEPISAEQCRVIRNAIRTYGIAAVEASAAARGYTRTQIAQARAYCL